MDEKVFREKLNTIKINKYDEKDILSDLNSRGSGIIRLSGIVDVLGIDAFFRLMNFSHDGCYFMMCMAYEKNVLENWKKILEVRPLFIPKELQFITNKVLLENNSAEDIDKLNQRAEYEKNLRHLPDSIYYVMNVPDILETNVSYMPSYIDSEFVSLMENEDYSEETKEKVKEVIRYNLKSNYSLEPEAESFGNDLVKAINTVANYHYEKIHLIDKLIKFSETVHFIPTLNVVESYPEDQIEKFNKKIWFSLARYELFNKNNDTKNSLIEAILSLGIFEKDENWEERIGLLQKFATYLPKEEISLKETYIDDELIEHFEVISKENEKLVYRLNREKMLSDPNIINLFNSREEAEKELRKLSDEFTPEQFETYFDLERDDEKYDKIMKYIYKTCYEKVCLCDYKLKLKTDIQQLKMKDKRKGQMIENKVRELYYQSCEDLKETMTPDTLHRIFNGMDMKYKEGFFEFFRDNLKEIMSSPDRQKEISKIQRQWEKIVEVNLGQKINFEKCQNYIYGNQYENVEEDEEEIAKLSSISGYSQEDFDRVKEIFERQKTRTISSIPQIERKNKRNGYTYKVLRLDDPIAIFVGELTKCCQALNNNGESCMIHSATSKNGRVLVVLDEKGKVVSQSWIWRNKNVLCFDNIEAIKKDSDNKKIISSDILDMVKLAAREFVEKDKIGTKNWKARKIEELKKKKEDGKISKKQYDIEVEKIDMIIKNQQLTKVTVGVGNTDVNLKGLKYDDENRYPEESVDYIDDSREQLILYEDDTVKHENSGEDTVSMYTDPEDSEKLINVDTSEIDDDDFDEFGDDEVFEDEDYYDSYYEKDYEEQYIYFSTEAIKVNLSEIIQEEDEHSKINMDDVRKTVNHVTGRNKAREALRNIVKYLNDERGK